MLQANRVLLKIHPHALLIFCVAILFSTAESQAAELDELLNTARIEKIHLEPGWLALGHYRKKKLTGRQVSDIDDAGFFLSPQGASDPAAELLATIRALFSNTTEAENIRCRFPARWHWLKGRFSGRGTVLDGACSEFIHWRDEIGATAATLVFPAAFLDSPSSMFGHTLLRLDKSATVDQSRLLSYSVSYAATRNEDDSELKFVYRGLVGGYPGDTAVVPYYLKIREYSDIESRDIWEYRLRLDKEQVAQFVRHLWEVKDLRVDYYFFSENCSYRLLALLNVVVPKTELLRQFPLYTIPVATVRALYRHDLIESAYYRPSVVTRFNHSLDQLDSEEQALVSLAAKSPALAMESLQSRPALSRARILDVAYSYSRMLPGSDKSVRNNSLQLLESRSKLNTSADLKPVPIPMPRDDQGHESERFSLGAGTLSGRDYVSMNIRPAYHDLTDPAAGYPIGSRLEFSSGTVRRFEDDEFQVHDYRLIGITSIKARNHFFKPTSWSVELGASRDTLDRSQRLTPHLWGQVGHAWKLRVNLLGYGFIGAELNVGGRLPDRLDTLARVQTGLLWRTRGLQSHLNLRYRDSLSHGFEEQQQASVSIVKNLSQGLSVSVDANQDLRFSDTYDFRVSVQYFH